MSNHLILRRTVRSGGGGKTERAFLDFVIDGQSLFAALGRQHDLVSSIGWGTPESHRLAVGRLLGGIEPDLPSGRVAIYICPECGDLGCGAIGVRVTRDKGVITWSDAAYEHPYVDDLSQAGVEGLGPYEFAVVDYESAIRNTSILR